MNENEIIQKIILTFPDIKEDIEEDNDLFHSQMFVFSNLAQNAIDNEDKNKFLQVCELMRVFLLNSSGDIKNALHVSFLEHLNFQDSKKTKRSWAYELMPKVMKESYEDIMRYNKELLKKKT